MKKIKTVIALLMAVAMLFTLAACGDKGPDVTGKYLCIGERYGDTGEFSEPYTESWVELKRGGKGTYSSGFDFDLKWKLDGETFSGTVTFLGMEETLEGTLVNGMLEAKYGDMWMRFVKEGMDPNAAAPGNTGANTDANTGNTGDDTQIGSADGQGAVMGANDNVKVADTMLDAFADGVASLGMNGHGGDEGDWDIDDNDGGETGMGIIYPEYIENPSTWYGYVYLSDFWGVNGNPSLDDAWGYVDTTSDGMPYFEIFQENDPETPFLSMYITMENGDTVLRPDIGEDDAWMNYVFMEPGEEDNYTFALLDDGTLSGVAQYVSPDGSFGYSVFMCFRPEGSLWDEGNEMLPNGYEDYKVDIVVDPGFGGGYWGMSTPDATGLVDDFDVLKEAREKIRNRTGSLYYEDIREYCGGVDGLYEAGLSDDVRNYYRWTLSSDDTVSILAGFLIEEEGVEKYNNASFSGLS